MVFEHFAINVADVGEVVDWYTTHLDLTIASRQEDPPYMTFLSDSSGRMIWELYQRADAKAIDFPNTHHLTFHLAFVSEDANSDAERLIEEGCTLVEKVLKQDGSVIIMLRDPWGMPLQLCQRG